MAPTAILEESEPLAAFPILTVLAIIHVLCYHQTQKHQHMSQGISSIPPHILLSAPTLWQQSPSLVMVRADYLTCPVSPPLAR